MKRIDKLREYLRETPQDNFLRHALAMEYLKTGEEKEAQQLLETILNECPEYVGSYYQLAKLLEKNGETEKAVFWYERGMEYAKKANENHTFNELKSALEELLY